MASELQLLQEEEIGGFASVIASLLLIFSSLRGQEYIYYKEEDITPPNRPPSSGELALDSSLVFILVAYIFTATSYTRYDQRRNNTPEGQGKEYAFPEGVVFIGSLIILIGYIILAEGTKLEIDRDQPVVI